MDDIRLGKFLGIEIFISYSWFFIFGLVTVALSFGFFPQRFPAHSALTNVTLGVFASALFFMSLLFHEFSHSVIANRNRIPIKKITLFIFGGMSQMSEEPGNPSAEFKMAIAGPASSFFLAAVFFSLFKLISQAGAPSQFYAAFGWLAEINLFLGVFNLAPGFPLDGGRVLRAAVWSVTKNIERATNVAAKSGQAIAFVLISLGVLTFLFGQLGGIWLILIGWFLYQAAIGSYRQVVIQHSLANVDVTDIMSPQVQTVQAATNLDDLVNHYFLKQRVGRFPVMDDERLLGVVTLHDVKEVPRERWPSVTAGNIVEPIGEEMFVKPRDPAMKALVKMAEEDVGHLLVVDEKGRLAGIITRADIIKIIRVRTELNV